MDPYTLVTKGPTNDWKYSLINPSKVGKNGYRNSGALIAKVKLLSKVELTSQDPKLIEDLVVRAPFLLGWQPGLELKSLQNNRGKLARAKTTAATGSSANLLGGHSVKGLDLKLQMQQQSAQGVCFTLAPPPRRGLPVILCAACRDFGGSCAGLRTTMCGFVCVNQMHSMMNKSPRKKQER